MDDVSFMQSSKTTVQESFMFMADSRTRDKVAYPSPSEYTIEFNAPFRNVCSFSLLDATIPRTHYNVDTDSNTLVYTLQNDTETHTLTVDPGDYTLPQLLTTMNSSLLGGLRVDPLTTPYDISNKVRFSRDVGSFALDMAQSSLKAALGFGESRGLVHSTPSTASATAHAGPYAESQTVPVSTTQWIRQKIVAQASGSVTKVVIASDPSTVESPAVTLLVSITSLTGTVHATATVYPFRTAEATDVTTLLDLEAGQEYYVVLKAGTPTATIAYVAVGEGSGPAQLSSNSGAAWTNAADDIQLCMDLEVSNPASHCISTGLVDLTGEKLVLIRCPEIEQVMFRDRFNEKGLHPGLGYVKLGGLGFREQRSDYFVPFAPRVFHAIGKLSKLTIRLEKPDGTLYNARGVDHFLLMNITYYKVGAGGVGGNITQLNPNYTPDVHAFLAKKWQEDAWNNNLSVTYSRRGGDRG